MRWTSKTRARATKTVIGLVASGFLASAAFGSAIASHAGADTACAITTSSTNDPAQVLNDPHSMFNTLRSLGASAYYQHGYFGQGVDVALIDTGVAPIAGLNSGNVVHGPDLSFESQSPGLAHNDTFGHGTHMAAIIAGRDFTPTPTYYEDPTKFQGVAPMARVVSVKVGDSQGAVDVSQIIAGIDWVVVHRHDNGLNIRVLNLSLAYPALDDASVDALSYAANEAVKHGVLVVASAGNSGRAASYNNNLMPAANPYVLAVGSYDPATASMGSITKSTFSSINYDGDSQALFAPGQSIGSLHVAGSYADTEILNACQAAVAAGQPWTQPVWGPDGRYVKGSGTSQAAAIVSGAAALLFSQHPNWSVDQAKIVLADTTIVPCGNLLTYTTQNTNCRILSLPTTYSFTPAVTSYNHGGISGGSPLDSARGNSVLSSNGVSLTGNTDWFGNPLDMQFEQNHEPKADEWKIVKDSSGKIIGESWNGELLTGEGFASDPLFGPSVWTGHSWSGADWRGHSWSTDNMTGHSWSGHSWSGIAWDADSFTGHSWSGHAWDDFAWN